VVRKRRRFCLICMIGLLGVSAVPSPVSGNDRPRELEFAHVDAMQVTSN
jgi:hypothetical protein